MQIREAVILAGGKGSRITDITKDQYHKSLVEVKGKPILSWQIEWLNKYGVRHIVLALGHHSQVTIDLLEESRDLFKDVEVSYVVEEQKLGSGGAFKLASTKLKEDRCYVVNGDVMTLADLNAMTEVHERKGVQATMLLVNMTSPYGIAKIEGDLITSFIEKPRLDLPIHAGVDILERETYDRFPDVGQMEDTIFTELVKERQFAAYLMPNEVFWKSVDTSKDYMYVRENWPGLD